MKFKTPEFVSKMKKRLNKDMNRFFSIIPPKYLVGAAGVVFIIVLFASCKKQTDCTPGAKSYANPEGIQKSPKSPKSDDPCAFERNAADQAKIDSADYRLAAEDALSIALTEPGNISQQFWLIFNSQNLSHLPSGNFVDSLIKINYTIRAYVDELYPSTNNKENLEISYAINDTCVLVCYDLRGKLKDLKDCEDENGVGIDENEIIYICNEKGFWERQR